MRNRALALAARPIPYIKELREITGAVTAAILMQQLDHWFNVYPEGFYKFLSPCDSPLCKAGEAWTEELGFSEEEFRTAFDRIGVRYGSKRSFDAADNAFLLITDKKQEEMLYASYHDKIKGLTYYFRNHELVDAKIDEIMARRPAPETGKAKLRNRATPSSVTRQSQVTETENPDLRKQTTPGYVTGEPQATELGNPNPEYKETKKTSEKTTEKTKEDPKETGGSLPLNNLTPILLEAYRNIAKEEMEKLKVNWQAQLLVNDGLTTDQLCEWIDQCGAFPPIPTIATNVRRWLDANRRQREKRNAVALVGLNREAPAVSIEPEPEIEKPARKGAYAKVLELLAESLPDAAIVTWFEPLTERRLDDGVLHLAAPNQMATMFRDFIENNYGDEFYAAIERAGLAGVVIGEAIQAVETEAA
jgi:hypothetical protein